jgi:hypothetical protein
VARDGRGGGEGPGGVWLRIQRIRRPTGEDVVPKLAPDGSEIPEIYLLRWDTVATARLFTEVPDPTLQTGLYL